MLHCSTGWLLSLHCFCIGLIAMYFPILLFIYGYACVGRRLSILYKCVMQSNEQIENGKCEKRTEWSGQTEKSAQRKATKKRRQKWENDKYMYENVRFEGCWRCWNIDVKWNIVRISVFCFSQWCLVLSWYSWRVLLDFKLVACVATFVCWL